MEVRARLQSGRKDQHQTGFKRSLREQRPDGMEVPKGRLNLAQDAVLGRDSKDEKSRRDDWNPPGISRYFAVGEFLTNYPASRIRFR